MRTPWKLSLFSLGLGAVFTVAFGGGRLVGPATVAEQPPHPSDGHHSQGPAGPPGGLQVAQDGYRLQPLTTGLSTQAARTVRFRILGPDDAVVTSYAPTHEKLLHLIVVRRDLTGFQHLHPTLEPDGTWSVPVRVAAAGQYRILADFLPAGRTSALTLGVDVAAPGDFQPRPLPAASRTTTADGYTVTVEGDLVPGTSSRLTMTVTKGGRPVTDLQPYLAAYGHLVALREGDLAYLHVHPDGAPGDGRTHAGPGIVFYAEVPSAGSYRLFLDFRHGGVVRTAAFTAVAGPPTQPKPQPGQADHSTRPDDGAHP